MHVPKELKERLGFLSSRGQASQGKTVNTANVPRLEKNAESGDTF